MRWRSSIVIILVSLRGTQSDLIEKKLASHGYLFFSNFFISQKLIISMQSMNTSTKKLVKRLIVNIDSFKNCKKNTRLIPNSSHLASAIVTPHKIIRGVWRHSKDFETTA